jgi:prophage antirepressor-like protein
VAGAEWVYEEVLPAIRRTGGYMVSRPGETEAEVLARAVLIARETLARKDAAIALEHAGRVRAESNVEVA